MAGVIASRVAVCVMGNGAGILGADAVSQRANTGTHPVEEFRFGGCARGVSYLKWRN